MAGHSHWANIKHKKAASDAKKAAVITKMGKLIKVAVQLGGPDPDANPRLRLAVSKARAQNMTMDAINRTIKKAAGDTEASKAMEELVYEGYAEGGVAVVVETLTDNRNRTAPELRKLFERGGGSLGSQGCVSWQFHQKAVFAIEDSDEDTVIEALIEAEVDAEDVVATGDGPVVTGAPDQYEAIRSALEKAGITIARSDLTRIPENEVAVTDPASAKRIQDFLDRLDDHEDVQTVATNFAPTPEIADQL